jgi:hypothetical protein
MLLARVKVMVFLVQVLLVYAVNSQSKQQRPLVDCTNKNVLAVHVFKHLAKS